MIASLYIIFTYISAAMGLAYGNFQLRLSEVLTILPIFTPAAIPGLTIGCFFSNLSSPFGFIDWVFGSLSTFLCSVLTRKLRNIKINDIPILAPIPPIIANALVVSMLLILSVDTQISWKVFLPLAFSVSAGEAVMCFLGLGLSVIMKKSGIASRIFDD